MYTRLHTMSELGEISSTEGSRVDLCTPYSIVTTESFSEKFPERKPLIRTVLKELDRQMIENFKQFKSEKLPVTFAYTKVAITPQLLERLGSPSKVDHKDSSNEWKDYFLFSAMGLPPEGSPFTVQDVGIDRFIRSLTPVARALREGQVPPEIAIYFCGSPTGFGGEVSPEWIQMVNKEGMDVHGKLYAEFIEQEELKRRKLDPVSNTAIAEASSKNKKTPKHIVLQGVSKGAVVANRTFSHLPEGLQQTTQQLFDNPAGHHKRGIINSLVRGTQAAVGLGREIWRTRDIGKALSDAGTNHLSTIQKEKGLLADSPEQKKLKMSAFLADGKSLFLGEPVDTTQRSYVRRGIQDPLTTTRAEIEALQKNIQEKTPVISETDKSLETRFMGNHFFFYNRYKRWAQILDYCSGAKRKDMVNEQISQPDIETE